MSFPRFCRMLYALLLGLCLTAISRSARAAPPGLVWSAPRHGNPVGSVMFSPDGQTLAYITASGNGGFAMIELRRVSDGGLIDQIKNWSDRPGGEVWTMDFSPDSRLLAYSGSFERTEVRDIHLHQPIRTYGAYGNVYYSPGGELTAVSNGELYSLILRDENGYEPPPKYLGRVNGYSSILTFRPDGKTFFTWGEQEIREWDAATVTPLRTLATVDSSVLRRSNVALSPDGLVLAYAVSGGIALRNSSDGSLLRTLPGHDGPVTALAFSLDGRTLASGGTDSVLRFWNVSDGTLIQTLNAHEGEVTALDFSPDGTALASSSTDGTVKLWRVADLTLKNSWVNPNGEVAAVSFTPDGKQLVSLHSGKAVQVWDAADGTPLQALKGDFAPGYPALGLGARNGSVSVARNTDVLVWDGVAGDPPRSFPLPGPRLGNSIDSTGWDVLKFSPTGETFAINTTHYITYGSPGFGPSAIIGQGHVEIRNTSDGSLRADIEEKLGGASDLAYSPDGKIFAGLLGISTVSDELVNVKPGIYWHNYVVTRESWLRLFDAADGTLLQTHPLRDNLYANHICFSNDGRYLAFAYTDGTVEVWDVLKDARARTISTGTDRLAAVALSQGGRILAAATAYDVEGSGRGTSLSFWNVADGRLLQRSNTSDMSEVGALAFSPDGKRYAYGGYASTVTVAETPGLMPPRMGDINGDGIVAVEDAVLALRIIVGIDLPITPEESVADVNRDTRVDVVDVFLILGSIVFGTSLE